MTRASDERAELMAWMAAHKAEHAAAPLHKHEAPEPEPPAPEPASGIYGPGIGAEGKGNLWIGMNATSLPKREVGHRWRSQGGRMTSYAYNQRTGPGYSLGDGGEVELTLYRCGAAGLPEGSPLSRFAYRPGNTAGHAENTKPLSWSADIPAGLVCVMHRNLAPNGNFISANELWNTVVDTPRQPAFPDDSLAVLFKDEHHGLQVQGDHTPVFDVTFSDGRHEGQAYHERYVDAQEAVISTACRERFTPTKALQVTAVGFRVLRRTATSLRFALGGQTATVDISGLPVERSSDGRVFTGHRWVKAPLSVSLPANVEQSCVITPVGGEIRVSPLRYIDGWGSRHFTEGTAEKLVGGSWQPFYAYDQADLQWYLA